MKRLLKMSCLFIVGLSIMLISGCSSTSEATPAVQTAEIKNEVKIVEAFGKVVIKDQKNLVIDFPAVINEVYVDEGEKVKEGDLLISLDLTEVTSMLDQKRLALKVAKNELEAIMGKYNLAKMGNKLSQEQEALQREHKTLKRLEEELASLSTPALQKLIFDIKVSTEAYERQKVELEVRRNLMKEKAISQQAFDQFKEQTEQKEHEVKNLELTLADQKHQRQLEIDNLKFSISAREKAISYLEIEIEEITHKREQSLFAQNAKIEQLENEVEQLETKLAKNFLQGDNVVANVPEGIVLNIGYVSGEPVVAQKSLLSLKDLHLVLVEANVPEEFIKDIDQGAEAVIIPLADPNRKYHGEVINISNMAVRQGGETVVPVEISMNDLDDFLLENFNVDVEITKN